MQIGPHGQKTCMTTRTGIASYGTQSVSCRPEAKVGKRQTVPRIQLAHQNLTTTVREVC